MNGALELLEPDWEAPPGVRAAFTLRTGGVSAPPYDSFNCATHVGDEPQAVERNRARLRERLALPREPAWLEQVHGRRVVELGEGDGPSEAADAAVACAAGRVCVVQVADCLPVLLAVRDGSAVGAAHAGWRGLAAELRAFPRQALHAAHLALEHPLSGKRLECDSPLPADMARLLAALEQDERERRA